jgi:hypothetical protein
MWSASSRFNNDASRNSRELGTGLGCVNMIAEVGWEKMLSADGVKRLREILADIKAIDDALGGAGHKSGHLGWTDCLGLVHLENRADLTKHRAKLVENARAWAQRLGQRRAR